MAYKRNPMRSERMTGLARKLMGLPANFAATAGNQWFERTLDDSAIRRMDIAQAFLLTDAVLRLYINISENMVGHKLGEFAPTRKFGKHAGQERSTKGK